MNEIQLLEDICRGIHEAVEKNGGDYWRKRIAVAFAFGGYMDAKFMRHLHETYGLHVADQVVKLSKAGIKIPWEGLRYEFLAMGMNDSSVASMLGEAREFERRPARIA